MTDHYLDSLADLEAQSQARLGKPLDQCYIGDLHRLRAANMDDPNTRFTIEVLIEQARRRLHTDAQEWPEP